MRACRVYDPDTDSVMFGDTCLPLHALQAFSKSKFQVKPQFKKILPDAELKIVANSVRLVIWSHGFPTLITYFINMSKENSSKIPPQQIYLSVKFENTVLNLLLANQIVINKTKYVPF